MKILLLVLKSLITPIFAIPFVGWILGVLLIPFTVLAIIPVFLVAGLLAMIAFGAFHITSYDLQLGAMVFAGIVFGVWLLSYALTKEDDTAMNVSHYLWNAFNTAKEGFSIAGTKLLTG